MILAGIFTGFFLCGSFFLSKVVLPAVSSRAGIEIVADEVKWSCFSSRLEAENLRIGPAEAPCFSAGRAKFRYGLPELLKGTLKFSDIHVEQGEFTLFRVPGGWSCFRPSTPAEGKKRSDGRTAASAQPKPEKRAKKKLRFDLSRIRISDSRLMLVYGEGGAGGAFALSGLSGYSPGFQNGRPFSAELAGRVKLATSRASHVNDGRMKLVLDSRLNDALQPESLQLQCELTGLSGRVGGAELHNGALSLDLEGRLSGNGFDIGRFHLVQSRNHKPRSVIDLTGSLSWSPFSIDAAVKRGVVSPEVLAICTDLGLGFNPGRAALECSGRFSYGKRRFFADGTLRLTRAGDAIFGLERIDVPDFRLDMTQRAEVDFNRSEIRLDLFSATVVTEGRETASLRLRRPVRYSWLKRAEEKRENAEFDLVLDRFDLQLLRFALPPDFPIRGGGGILSGKVQLLCRHNLSSVGVLGNGRLEKGRGEYRGRSFPMDEVLFGLDLQLRRNFDFHMNNISLSLRKEAEEIGALSCSGKGSLRRGGAELQLHFERLSPELATWFDPACAPVVSSWKRLGISPVDLSVSVAVAGRGEPVHFRDCRLSVDREGKELASLRLNSFSWLPREGMLDHGPDFTFHCAGPLSMFNPFFRKGQVTFSAGQFQCSLTGRMSRQLDGGVVDGECAADEVEMRCGGRNFSGFGLQNRFSFYFPDFNTMEIKTADFYLRRHGRPALRLECPGTFQFQEGRYRGEWQLRYLNEQFLKLFSPVLAAEAQFSGKMQVNAGNHLESFRAAAALECSRWLAPDREGLPFNGRLLGVFEYSPLQWSVRNFRLKFNRAERLLADFNGECRVDRFQADGPVAVRLSAPRIELGELLKLFSGSGFFGSSGETVRGNTGAATAGGTVSAAEKKPAEKHVPMLRFGARPVDFSCRVEKLCLTPELDAVLEGRFRLKNGDVHSEYLNLVLGGARFDAEVRASSRPEGIRGMLAVRGNDRFPCRPLLEFLSGVRDDGFEGVLTSLNARLSWLDDGRPEGFLNTLSGYFRMKLRDVTIPNGVANTLFGRLLLLPVDLVKQLSNLMPEELAELSGNFFSTSALQRTLRTIHFSSGELDLSADHGEVNVRQCQFLGDWIDRIGFSGRFQLGGQQKLQLESQLAIGGIPLAVPVRGTLTNPSVAIQQGATAGIVDFIHRLQALKLLDFATGVGGEPTLLIHDLSPKETLRELRYIFDELFKQKR